MSNFKQLFVRVMEVTQDPLAPITVQEAYSKIGRLGKLMATLTDKDKVHNYRETLLGHLDDEFLNKACGDPAFVMALAAMLNESILAWVRGLR